MPQRTYPAASSAGPVTPADLRGIIETHGLRFSPEAAQSLEGHELRRLYQGWIAGHGIRPDLAYAVPLRVLFDLLCASHGGRSNERGVYAWRVLTDAINEPADGVQIVARRFSLVPS